nr:glycosyltransferase family 1 protein [uncultured Blautia sp.]
MKVLQIGMGNNPGGVEAFVMNYYRQLSKRGIRFDFVSMYGEIAYHQEILSLGGRVFLVPNVKKDYFGYVKAMKKILSEGKYDVVHVNMLSAANILPLRLAKEAGVGKVIAHSHNASAPGMLRRMMDQWNRSKISRYADVLAACGEKAGRWLFGDQAYEQGKVTLLSNAIDVDRFLFSEEKRKKVRESLELTGSFVIGHVGRFQLQKNHERILEIFRQILETEPDARLLLVGEGELLPRIREKACEYQIEKQIVFAGVRSDVEDCLCAMDVFLFPSLFEGLPFTLVEAQANGLSCVISDKITREVVLDQEKVCCLDLEKDDKIWAEKVLSYKEYKREDQKKTKERLVAAHFDIHKEADRLLELYSR